MSKANIKLSLGTKPNLLMITDNGKQQIITVDMLKNIWDNLSEDEISDIGYINAEVYNEYAQPRALFLALTTYCSYRHSRQ